MKEVRYAVLIGLDDYDKDPLEYSVKDACDFKESLIEYCNFNKQNIFLITNKDIAVKEQVDNAFKEISNSFIANKDLLLFYFSGHGTYDEAQEKSTIQYSDNTYSFLGDIVDQYTAPLKAKNEYLIIDACHAGKNILTKSGLNSRKKESQLFHNSKEVYFLFAAEHTNKAYQYADFKNSIYTYYLNEAIVNRDNYNSNGHLSMSAIDDYIREKISRHDKIVQIPGSESRSSGYKPFAFLNKRVNGHNKTNEENHTEMSSQEQQNKIEFDLQSSTSSDRRSEIKDMLTELINSDIQTYRFSLPKEYNISKGYFIENDLHHKLQDSLYKEILTEAKSKGLWAIERVFESNTIKPNKRSAMQSIIYGEPEPTTTYHVFFNSSIQSEFIKIESDSIYNVNAGMLVMYYQTKYGFTLGIVHFKYEWNGLTDVIDKIISVSLHPYLIRKESIELCKGKVQEGINLLISYLEDWNNKRKLDIDGFLSKAE